MGASDMSGRQPSPERGGDASPLPPAPILTANGDEAAREARRLAKADVRRPLEPWERYRALIDTLEEAHKLADLGDHKARFALVIMGALNVVLFVVGTRSDLSAVPGHWRPWLTAYLVVYALVALYFFAQAIEALRPRRLRLHVPLSPDGQGGPVGLRFHEDALLMDAERYGAAWATVRIDQLIAELAAQAHTLAHVNRSQYLALRRLYRGLHVMVALLTGLLLLDALIVVSRPAAPGLRPAAPAVVTPALAPGQRLP